MSFLLLALGGGFATILVIVSALIALIYSPLQIFGFWLYIIGWSISGHGIEIGILRFNLFSIWTLGLTFFLWAIILWILRKVKLGMDIIKSAILWVMIFVVVFIAWNALGYGLMYVAEEQLGLEIPLKADIEETYSKYSPIIEFVLLIPYALLIYLAILQGYWKYALRKTI